MIFTKSPKINALEYSWNAYHSITMILLHDDPVHTDRWILRTPVLVPTLLHGPHVYHFPDPAVHGLDFIRVHVYDQRTWSLSRSQSTKVWPRAHRLEEAPRKVCVRGMGELCKLTQFSLIFIGTPFSVDMENEFNANNVVELNWYIKLRSMIVAMNPRTLLSITMRRYIPCPSTGASWDGPQRKASGAGIWPSSTGWPPTVIAEYLTHLKPIG